MTAEVFSTKADVTAATPRDLLLRLTAVVTARLPDEASILEDTIAFWYDYLESIPSLEVILVTNGAGRVARSTLSRPYRTSRFHHIDASGFSESKSANLNAALSRSRTPIVAFFDTDSRPRIDALQQGSSEAFSAGTPVQGAKIVDQSRPNTISGILAYNCARIEYRVNYVLSGGLLRERTGKPGYFAGSNGYFPREQLSAYLFRVDCVSEDLDLSARIYYDEGSIRYVPTAIALEAPPVNLRAYYRQHTRWITGWLETLRSHGRQLLSRPKTLRVWAPILLWPVAVYIGAALLGTILISRYGSLAGTVGLGASVSLMSLALARMAAMRLRRLSVPDDVQQRVSDVLGAAIMPFHLVALLAMTVKVLLLPPKRLRVTNKPSTRTE
jgi:hypothetical protein